MAKITPRPPAMWFVGKRAPRFRLLVTIMRTRGPKSRGPFEACVWAPRGRRPSMRDSHTIHGGCAHGRNPRIAYANALRHMAANVMRREGAFQGRDT